MDKKNKIDLGELIKESIINITSNLYVSYTIFKTLTTSKGEIYNEFASINIISNIVKELIKSYKITEKEKDELIKEGISIGVQHINI